MQMVSLRIWYYIILICSLTVFSCSPTSQNSRQPILDEAFKIPALTLEQANQLAQLPLKCIQKPYPYKPGHVLSDASDIDEHTVFHPSFYGCFDWHSAVHAHWSLLYLLKHYPSLERRSDIIRIFNNHFTKEHIQQEMRYFELNKYTASFERTYGWAWVFKLHEELLSYSLEEASIWSANLDPLVQLIREKYIEYLPKLSYPIRVGEHSNTAFGLNFAYDYAFLTADETFLSLIESRSKEFYAIDSQCPLDWEPSGYDFLSPCLEEASLMSKILEQDTFNNWFSDFLGSDSIITVGLKPAEIKDRTDGKLVHLDGLNFSRAWNLYMLSSKDEANNSLRKVADRHLKFSLDNIEDGDYAGEHWLTTFALYALKMQASSVL